MRRLRVPTRPLQRMAVGMLLSGVAFVIAGFVQLGIDKGLVDHTDAVPFGTANVQLFSAYPSSAVWTLDNTDAGFSQGGAVNPYGSVPFLSVL